MAEYFATFGQTLSSKTSALFKFILYFAFCFEYKLFSFFKKSYIHYDSGCFPMKTMEVCVHMYM